MTQILSIAALVAVTTVPAWAGPLNPAEVPAGAKWLFHVNFDAARKTELAEAVREHRGQRVQKAAQWMQQRYGIDPRADLHGITAYGTEYRPHTGVMLINAEFDRQKVESVIKNEPGYETTEFGEYTLHTWTAEDHRHHGRQGDRDAQDDAEDQPAQARRPEAEGEEQPERHHKSHARRVTAVFPSDDLVIVASSPEAAQHALRVIEGEAENMEGSDSPLLTGMPSGTIFYGAAVDLAGLKNYGHPRFPVLRHADRMRVSFGEDAGELVFHSTLRTDSEQTAELVEDMVEGLRSFLRLTADESRTADRLYRQIDVESDDRTVTVDWQAPVQDVIAAIRQMRAQRGRDGLSEGKARRAERAAAKAEKQADKAEKLSPKRSKRTDPE